MLMTRIVHLLPLFLILGCSSSPPQSDPNDREEKQAAHYCPREDPFYAEMHRSFGSDDDSDLIKIPRSVVTAGLSPENQQVLEFVQHVADSGIPLVYDQDARKWRTIDPVVGNWAVAVSIRALPRQSTPRQMQLALAMFNEASGLNTKAHLAMSKPSLVYLKKNMLVERAEFDAAIENKSFQSTRDRLKQIFLSYRIE